MFCATLGVETRVGFRVSCQLLLLGFKEKWVYRQILVERPSVRLIENLFSCSRSCIQRDEGREMAKIIGVFLQLARLQASDAK